MPEPLSQPIAETRQPIEIATKLQTPEMQRLFKPESRRPGAWNDEQPHLKQQLGPLGPILPLHMTPEARRAQYLVRADALLMAEGFLPPNTPEFALAQRVVAELVIAQRPDVVLWTLKAFYPENAAFQKITKGSELAAAIQSGTVQLPPDYRQKVDILAQFDEFEAVGDPNQPTRKQTPLIPIIAEVAKSVKELAPQKTDQLKKETPPQPVTLPVADEATPARDVLGTILNSELLTPEQRTASRKAYEQAVERAMGKVPTEAYKPKEVPGEKTPIRLSEESQKDTVAHAEDPGWGRNRQYGLISLADSYFGGALGLFTESMQTIAAHQLEPLGYRHLHDRASGIIALAENQTQREQVGDLLRERLRKMLTADCTFGYEYTDRDSIYASRRTSQRMISDLPVLADEKAFLEGKSRGLYLNIPDIRRQMESVREVLRTLKQAEGDYFDVLDHELGTFIDGQFLKDADRFQTQTSADYTRRYTNQVTAALTGESPEKHVLFPGVEALQRKLENAIKHAPTGYYASSDRTAYMRKISDALNNPTATLEDPQMQEDLERARAVMAEVTPEYDGNSWRSTSLIAAEKSDSGASLGEEILHSAAKNKTEFAALGHVLQSMAFMYDMSELYAAIPADRRPETPLWEPQPQGISLKKATNAYAVLRMVMAGGKPLSDFTEYDQYTDPVRHRGDRWPPQDESYVQRDYERHIADLKKAFEYITPVDIEVTADRPIALIVGNNGSGKTFAMETLVQSMGFAERTGVQPFTVEQRTVYSPTIRAMINASRHQERISSYQSEVDLMVSVLKDIKSRDKNSCAVWAIDEIGKGTDSRDALALLFGTIEWARRNNVHFVVSTHYGRQFMELATMLGLDGSIQIYNPNAETHELMPNTEVTASHGIEVMEKMGRKNEIPIRLLNALAENARRIRRIHDNRDHAALEPIETTVSARSIQFVHDEDLADIGLSTTKRDTGDSGNFAMSALPEKQFVLPKTLLGESMEYSYSSSESPLRTTARGIRSEWSGQFQRRFADRELTAEQIATRKGHIHEMVTLITKNPDASTTASQQMLVTAVGKRAMETATSAKALQDIHTRLEAFHGKEDPLKESFYIHDDGGKKEWLLFRTIAVPEKIAEQQKAAQEVAAYLTQEGVPDHIRMLGERIGLSDRIGQYLSEKTQIPQTEVSLRYNTAIARHILIQIRSTLVPYSSYGADSFKTYLPQMQEVFGTAFQKSEDVFTYLSEQVRNGDLSALFKFNAWLQAQEVPKSYGYSSSNPITTLKSRFGFFTEMQSGMATRLSKSKDALAFARTIVGEETATPESIAQRMQEAFMKGDCTLLDRLLSIPKLDAGLGYSSSEDALKKLSRINNVLATQRWAQWQDALAEMKQIARDNQTDYYAILHLNPRATPEEITTALAKARAENSAPAEDLQAAEKILLSDTRLAYDLSLADGAMSEAQFLFTVSGAIQRHNMCIPTHSEDGALDVTNGINLHLANTLGSQYVPQSLQVAGDTNTVVIGGMNGGGKSQTLIALADIMAWDHFIGYVPAEQAVLPKADFIVSAINAGESIVGMSSFQNEITRYLKVLDRYVEAGCPQSGMVFLDEPLAGTSSEDQAGILVSIVDFLQSRGVKVVMTNHNHAFFDVIRRTTGSTGEPIKFLPVAFGSEGSSQFELEYFAADQTDKIRSRGIDVAEERGVDKSIITVARSVRKLIDQIEEAKGKIHA